MKAKEIRDMDKKERDKKLNELKVELVKAKAQGPQSGNKKIKNIKKTIAQIMTINKSEEENK